MEFHSELLKLTQNFYAAAMADSGWDTALDPVVDFLGADHAMIIAKAPPGEAGAVSASARLHGADFARFLSPEGGRLMAPLQGALSAGRVAIGSQLVSDRHFESSELYNEILRPAGGFYSVGARNEQPGSPCFVAVCRSRRAGDFQARDAAILQALLPHLAMALELHGRLRAAEQERRQFGHVLDRLDAGVILTDAGARPIFVNAYAGRLAAADGGLKLGHHGLAGATAKATQMLRAAIAAVGAGSALESRRITLERPFNSPPLLLTIMPIWRFDAAVTGLGGATVAIIVKEPKNPMTAAGLDAAEAFHLTDREKEVASLIAGGHNRAQVAAALGVSEATVKTHLQNLFDKTGARRQVDLIKLLVEHASPFLG